MSEQIVESVKSLSEEEQLSTVQSILEGLNLGTVVKLVHQLEDAWDVQAKPQMSGGPPILKEEEEEEKTDFDVVVTDIGSSKVKVIKAVKTVTKLGLKEAKDLLSNLPAVIQKGLSKDDAETLRKPLEEAGATVQLQ